MDKKLVVGFIHPDLGIGFSFQFTCVETMSFLVQVVLNVL